MEVILFNYGIEISVSNGRYYLNFDEGELVPQFRTIEISHEEAKKAQLSQKDAYEVIISFQNREREEKQNQQEQ